MSESFTERLSRFTPDHSGLDRDNLLIAAGRASARPNRRWYIIASVLATTQLLTLVLLVPWHQSASPLEVATSAAPELAVVGVGAALEPSSVGNGEALMADAESLPRLAAVDDVIAADPPLRAFPAPGVIEKN